MGKALARGTRIAYEALNRRARGPKDSKPGVIGADSAYMRRVYGRKVTRLTLGDLSACLVLGRSRDRPMGGQKSAEGILGERQAELLRHSEAERRSQQIGRAVTAITEGLNK